MCLRQENDERMLSKSRLFIIQKIPPAASYLQEVSFNIFDCLGEAGCLFFQLMAIGILVVSAV